MWSRTAVLKNSSGHTQFTQKEIRIVSAPFSCYMKFSYLIIMFLMSDFVIYIFQSSDTVKIAYTIFIFLKVFLNTQCVGLIICQPCS